MKNRIRISEEQGVHEQWYAEAREMTLDKLPRFINKLVNDYEHDYSTICHAIAAAALAAACAINHDSEEGGISGFQAGAAMWRFVQQWQYGGNKLGLRILDYDQLLFPQYEYRFTTISREVWNALQKEAAKRLDSTAKAVHENADYCIPDVQVLEHWRSIVNGTVPFGLRVID